MIKIRRLNRMEFITRECFDKAVKNKDIINLEELVNIIENEFGYSVNIEEKNKEMYTKEQRKAMTKAIFNHPAVLKQLSESSFKSDNEYIEDDNEFIEFIREAQENDRQWL
jgi:hypothetical protein